MNRSLMLLFTILPLAALAQDAGTPAAGKKKLVGTKKSSAPKLDFGSTKFDEVPKDQLLQKPKADEPPAGTNAARPDESYSVVKVMHARSFLHGPDGAKPAAPFPQVTLSGNPPTTEKFSSVIRVKNAARRGAAIEVAVLDPRGDTVMSADGQLSFAKGADETEWSVDWAPTPVRGAGEYSLLIRVSGNPIGTFPIKIAETPK